MSKTSYKDESQKYIKLLNSLRSVGAHFSLDLPTIVFCGNQSAGKSSLIEAVSQINLPRSDGTCTRCPMEVRLQQVDAKKGDNLDWKCRISLRLEYDELSDKMMNSPVVKEFGGVITERESVELNVRRAQKALLNPSKPASLFEKHDFGNTTYEEDSLTNEMKFTRNIVIVDIRGPHCQNLSLIDLPGIIRYTEKDEDNKFIGLIEKLVHEYVKREKSIIIATISCKDEIDNQAIVSIARNYDASGSRTLGVLTKPDTIEEGCHSTWLNILSGNTHGLHLGYWMVKNPSKKELVEKITFNEARYNEEKFFKSTKPWDTIGNKNRLGVLKLAVKLSELLVSSLKTQIPHMKEKIVELIAEVHKRLRELPPPPPTKNASIEIFKLIQQFERELKNNFYGRAENNSLCKELKANFLEMKSGLLRKRPTFFDSYNHKGGGIVEFEKKVSSCVATSVRMDENDIKKKIEDAKGRQIAGFIPYEVFLNLVSMTQTDMDIPIYDCLDKVKQIFNEKVENLEVKIFGRFKMLKGKVRYLNEQLIGNLSLECKKLLEILVKLETSEPFTLNEDYLCEKIVSCKDDIKKVYDSNASRRYVTCALDEDVVEMVSHWAAYYHLFLQRTVDNASLIIDYFLLRSFLHRVSEELIDKLNIGFSDATISEKKEDECSVDELLSEDPFVVEERQELNDRLVHLEKVRKELFRYGL